MTPKVKKALYLLENIGYTVTPMNESEERPKSKEIDPETVGELVKVLQEYPQDWKIRGADCSHFGTIYVVTDGINDIIELY